MSEAVLGGPGLSAATEGRPTGKSAWEPLEHVPQLDGLRGLAVLLVVVMHAHWRLPNAPEWAHTWISLTEWGWTGVDLFFVLSGFLITSILWRYRKSGNYFLAFYGRRFLRIFPLYYLVLFLLLIVMPVVAPWMVANLRYPSPWYWLYGSNIAVSFYGWGPRYLSHFWSLGMEEQYYLVWPLVVWCAPSRRVLTGLALGALALTIATRWYLVTQEWMLTAPYTFPLARLDGFVLGGLVALWRVELGTLLRHPSLRTAMFAVIVAVPLAIAIHDVKALSWSLWTLPWSVSGYFCIAAYYTLVLVFVLEAPAGRWTHRVMTIPALVDYGKYSYAVYLLHVPVDTIFRKLEWHPETALLDYFWWSMPAYTIFLVLISYLLARISWWLLEERCMRLKRYFRYGPTKEAAAA